MRQVLRSKAVGQEDADDLGVGLGHHLRAAVLADVLGVVADQAVALARHPGLELAGSGELEALLRPRLGLQFRHFTSEPSGPVLWRIDEPPWHAFGQAAPKGRVSTPKGPPGQALGLLRLSIQRARRAALPRTGSIAGVCA